MAANSSYKDYQGLGIQKLLMGVGSYVQCDVTETCLIPFFVSFKICFSWYWIGPVLLQHPVALAVLALFGFGVL